MKFKIGDKVKIPTANPTTSNLELKDCSLIRNLPDGQDYCYITRIGNEGRKRSWVLGSEPDCTESEFWEKDLELYKVSNKILAKEYLYNTITDKDNSIVTTLENRDKFYKMLDILNIEYFLYSESTLTSYSTLWSFYSKDTDNIAQSSYSRVELKYIEFDELINNYKQILNK
jgi:hypothetical protein